MPPRNEGPRRPKDDAREIEEKYGEFADVYAESRSEAAEIGGDMDDKEYWETVADTVDGEDER